MKHTCLAEDTLTIETYEIDKLLQALNLIRMYSYILLHICYVAFDADKDHGTDSGVKMVWI